MKEKISVVVFTRYERKGASSRLRFFQYLPELRQKGFSFDVFPLFNEEYLKQLYSGKKISKLVYITALLRRVKQILMCFKYDLVWIEKELLPYMPATFERVLYKLGVKIIVDYDDAIFHNYDLSSNLIIRNFLKNKIDKVMFSATHVTAGNQYLAQRALDAGNDNVTIIPTVVEHEKYSIHESTNEQLVIGWIGTPATQKYIIALRGVFDRLALDFNFKLRLVGANKTVLEELGHLDIEVLQWTECSEKDLVTSFDIGIMPLNDGPWEKGKCGYKLIQYMACGIPVIASDIGVNKEIVSTANAGYLSDTHSDWIENFRKLLKSSQIRKEFGFNARQSVVNNYSVKSQTQVMTKVLLKAFRGK